MYELLRNRLRNCPQFTRTLVHIIKYHIFLIFNFIYIYIILYLSLCLTVFLYIVISDRIKNHNSYTISPIHFFNMNKENTYLSQRITVASSLATVRNVNQMASTLCADCMICNSYDSRKYGKYYSLPDNLKSLLQTALQPPKNNNNNNNHGRKLYHEYSGSVFLAIPCWPAAEGCGYWAELLG